jgi:hypothetical protein
VFLVSRPGDGRTLTPSRYAKQFVASDGDDATRTRLFKTVRVLRSKPPILSLECTEWSYEGGAHGTGSTSYLNFNPTTGAPVKLAEIVQEGALPRLTAVAERSPAANLKEEGFDFPNGFTLNDTYGSPRPGWCSLTTSTRSRLT